MKSALIARRDLKLEAQLAGQLGGARLGRPIQAFQKISSTMDMAHALAREGAMEGTLVFAKHQAQGRGRQGRMWQSPLGGAYFSLILRPSRPSFETPQLSLVAGLATAEAIQELTRLFPSIRWPNDILINDRKVAGILVEAKSGAVVVGIGVNVMTSPRQLPETATSLTTAGATKIDPHRMTGALCRRFQKWYDVWTAEGFGLIRESLLPHMGLFGQVVHITAGSTQFEGTATDLDEAGRLLVRLDSGFMRAFEMGEVILLR